MFGRFGVTAGLVATCVTLLASEVAAWCRSWTAAGLPRARLLATRRRRLLAAFTATDIRPTCSRCSSPATLGHDEVCGWLELHLS